MLPVKLNKLTFPHTTEFINGSRLAFSGVDVGRKESGAVTKLTTQPK